MRAVMSTLAASATESRYRFPNASTESFYGHECCAWLRFPIWWACADNLDYSHMHQPCSNGLLNEGRSRRCSKQTAGRPPHPVRCIALRLMAGKLLIQTVHASQMAIMTTVSSDLRQANLTLPAHYYAPRTVVILPCPSGCAANVIRTADADLITPDQRADLYRRCLTIILLFSWQIILSSHPDIIVLIMALSLKPAGLSGVLMSALFQQQTSTAVVLLGNDLPRMAQTSVDPATIFNGLAAQSALLRQAIRQTLHDGAVRGQCRRCWKA